MKYWNNNELRLTQPNSTTKQHDKTASLSLIILIERNWCCALTRQNSTTKQHGKTASLSLIKKLVLSVKMTKQHDVTTRRYDNVLFDFLSSHQPALFLSKQRNHNIQSTQASISHPYRCKISTESRKVLSIKIPQHYFY